MSNSFKSLLSDQVIALEWGRALKDVLCLFFWKCITLNGQKSLSWSLFDILYFLLKGLLTTSRLMYTIQKFWPAIFKIGMKTLICRIFLWKFLHEVKSIITFDYSDNYSGIQQNSTCNMENAQKRKMHVELARLHLQQFLSHNLFAGCVTEEKNRQHSHHPTAYYYSRESKSRWYATAIRIDYVALLFRPPIVECRRPKCLATWKWWVQFDLL